MTYIKLNFGVFCNNFNQLTNLSSASGPSSYVIKVAVRLVRVVMSSKGCHRNYNAYIFKKTQSMLAKYTFLIDSMPELLEIVNRNNIYTEIYFKMQYAISPMGLRYEPRCCLCRMGQILAQCKFVIILGDLYQITV